MTKDYVDRNHMTDEYLDWVQMSREPRRVDMYDGVVFCCVLFVICILLWVGLF